MSPEYAMHGQFSEKSDVFSFGVMVLEIISGKKNSCSFESHRVDDLVSYVSIKFLLAFSCHGLYWTIVQETETQIKREITGIIYLIYGFSGMESMEG